MLWIRCPRKNSHGVVWDNKPSRKKSTQVNIRLKHHHNPREVSSRIYAMNQVTFNNYKNHNKNGTIKKSKGAIRVFLREKSPYKLIP